MSPVDGPRDTGSDFIDILDRILDKGIVIDAEFKLTVAGLIFAGVEARIVVAGIETYLEHADDLAATLPASWRAQEPSPPEAQIEDRDPSPSHRFRHLLEGYDDEWTR